MVKKFLAVAVMVIMAVGSAFAQDCANTVNVICGVFAKMEKQIQDVSTINELGNLDFSRAVSAADISNIPDECQSYVLTKDDKSKLRKSFNDVFDAISTKTASLSGGLLSKQDMDVQFQPLKDRYNSCVDSAVTLGDFLDNFDKAFN